MSAAPIFDTAVLTLSSPFDRPLSFLGLELVVIACGVLTYLHALAARRAGDGKAMFTWVTIFVYGLVMELGSYNFVDNFAHGEFVVSFYRHKLPLYIVLVYPVLLYAAITTARRFRTPAWAEPFLAGLFIVAMDVPFDIAGPVTGWWSWSATDPVLAFRWLGVPVTSYYWHFAFGGILTALTRQFGAWGGDPRRSPARLALSFPIAILTIVLGVVAFIPFHVLKARGVADGTIVAALLAIGVAVSVAARKDPLKTGLDRRLVAIPILFYGYHLIVAAALLATGTPGWGARFGASVVVIAIAATAHALAHRDGARATEPRPA